MVVERDKKKKRHPSAAERKETIRDSCQGTLTILTDETAGKGTITTIRGIMDEFGKTRKGGGSLVFLTPPPPLLT